MSCEVERTEVIDQDGGWRTGEAKEITSILRAPEARLGWEPILTSDTQHELLRCGAVVEENFRSTLPFYCANNATAGLLLGHIGSYLADANLSFAEAPSEWVLYHLLLSALNWHLSERLTPEDDDALALAFANKVIDIASQKDLQYQLYADVSGLKTYDSELSDSTESILLRKLSPFERGKYLDNHRSGLLAVPSSPPTHLITILVSGPRREAFNYDTNILPRLLVAFQLHGFPISGLDAGRYSEPSWLQGWRSFSQGSLPTFTQGEPRMLSPDDFSAVIKTYRRLRSYGVMVPTCSKDLALHRFHSGLARRNATDALVDHTIALEALLLPYDQETRHSELSYRFRMHGAHWLAEAAEDKTHVAKDLNQVYGLRSRLVHGGDYPSVDDVEAGKRLAAEYSRKGLLRAVAETWPSPATFNRYMLGIDTDIKNGGSKP